MMRDILLRKSVIAFLLIAAAGIFAPLLVKAPPQEITGAPFARPLWWKSGTLPSARTIDIKPGKTEFVSARAHNGERFG